MTAVATPASIRNPTVAPTDALSQPVSTLMSSDVITVGRDADAAEIVDLMLEERLSALPVVETGTRELAGIVSYVDLLRAAQPLLEEDEAEEP